MHLQVQPQLKAEWEQFWLRLTSKANSMWFWWYSHTVSIHLITTNAWVLTSLLSGSSQNDRDTFQSCKGSSGNATPIPTRPSQQTQIDDAALLLDQLTHQDLPGGKLLHSTRPAPPVPANPPWKPLVHSPPICVQPQPVQPETPKQTKLWSPGLRQWVNVPSSSYHLHNSHSSCPLYDESGHLSHHRLSRLPQLPLKQNQNSQGPPLEALQAFTPISLLPKRHACQPDQNLQNLHQTSLSRPLQGGHDPKRPGQYQRAAPFTRVSGWVDRLS